MNIVWIWHVFYFQSEPNGTLLANENESESEGERESDIFYLNDCGAQRTKII